MSFRFIAAVCLAVCLPATPITAGSGESYSPGKLEAAYKATLLGFPIGEINWTIDLQDNRFSAAATGSTLGLLRIIAGGHGIASASGGILGQRPIASRFMVNITHGSASEEVKIVFSGGKAREHTAPPPPPNPHLVPLTEASRTGVLDPMTALLIHVPGGGELAAPAACDRTIAVFDGHMRFDLRLVFKRVEQVRANTGYQGPAVVCAAYFSPVAGYDPSRYAIKYLQAERDMEIWLAPLAGTRLLVPFRVSVPTPIGVGILQATRFVFTRQIGRSSAMNAN
jgi:hypothetical protein